MIHNLGGEHIIVTIVENKPGVLFRVTSMIRRRGFNIESISVGILEEGRFARMTIVLKGDERAIEQITKNLRKLVESLKVFLLNPEESVVRELALIRMHAEDDKSRSEVERLARIFRAKIVDVASDSMIVEITGDPEKINAFLNVAKEIGVKETTRTGITALSRGSRLSKA